MSVLRVSDEDCSKVAATVRLPRDEGGRGLQECRPGHVRAVVDGGLGALGDDRLEEAIVDILYFRIGWQP